MTVRLFLLDDDADLGRILADLLRMEDYDVETGTDPVAALERLAARPPDLLLLDIRMKGMDGLEVCRRLKSEPRTRGILIVMLSAKTDESDVVSGLEMGAEDYIRKPVQKAELIARVKAVLRRKEPPPDPDRIEIGPLSVDVRTYTARVNGEALPLRPKEFALLAHLARREGCVVTRQSLSEAVWGHEHVPTSKTINVHVYEVRRKLGPYGRWIEALKGVGYRFEVDG